MARSNSDRIYNIVVVSAASLRLILGTCSTDDGNGDKSAAIGNEATVIVADNHDEQTISTETDTTVVTDNRSFEMPDQQGIRLAAALKAIIPLMVSSCEDNLSVQDIGNHHKPNLEIAAAADPGPVVTGQRFDEYYDDPKRLAPNSVTMDLEPRESKPLDEEFKRHAKGMNTVFGKEKEVDQLIADFDKVLERVCKTHDPDVTVMALNSSGDTFDYITPTVGRTFGPLFDLTGMKPALKVDKASDGHQGDEISARSIVKVNPDFTTVLDHDAGTSICDVDEYRSAQSMVEGITLLKNMKAVKEGRIYYAPEDICTNESVITCTEIPNELVDVSEQA